MHAVPYPCYQTPKPARHPLVRLLQRQRLKQGRGAKAVSAAAGYSEKLLSQWEIGATADPNMQAFIDIVQTLGGKIVIEFPGEQVVL